MSEGEATLKCVIARSERRNLCSMVAEAIPDALVVPVVSLLTAPDGATSATDCPGQSASLAPSRIVRVVSPCTYWRFIS